MNAIFAECFSITDKDMLISKGFTFLPEQSSDEKFVFLNDGQFDFSDTKLDIKLHNNANV